MTDRRPVAKSRSLARLGEFGLIRNIRWRCSRPSRGIVVGIGDDAAVLSTAGPNVLVTSDMMIEGVHFDLSYTTFCQLGHKFLAVNVSDIFAMRGRPRFFSVSLGIPTTVRAADIDELYRGIRNYGQKQGVTIIGGDVSSSPGGLILSGSLIGTADSVITRGGAREGDGIFVTGTLGDSAMGLYLLKRRQRRILSFSRKTAAANLMKRHLLPEPSPLKRSIRVHALIDISDGLLADLGHVCDESSVGAVVHSQMIPLSTDLVRTAHRRGRDPLQLALTGGEDYTLLFTSPRASVSGAFRIGTITGKGRYIIDDKGKQKPFQSGGYEHFKGSD